MLGSSLCDALPLVESDSDWDEPLSDDSLALDSDSLDWLDELNAKLGMLSDLETEPDSLDSDSLDSLEPLDWLEWLESLESELELELDAHKLTLSDSDSLDWLDLLDEPLLDE